MSRRVVIVRLRPCRTAISAVVGAWRCRGSGRSWVRTRRPREDAGLGYQQFDTRAHFGRVNGQLAVVHVRPPSWVTVNSIGVVPWPDA